MTCATMPTLGGVKLNGEPTQGGVYINKEKKRLKY